MEDYYNNSSDTANVPTPPPEPVPQVSAAPAPQPPAPQPPMPPSPPPPASASLMPQPVVKVLSPRGLEYAFMTISLFTAAFGLSAALLALVNGETSFNVLGFPVALLLVGLPVFAWLFLRLKKAELADPQLRLDPSKRRSTQFTQIFTFVIAFFTLIGLVSTVFAKLSGSYEGSMSKVILDVLVIEAVAGGILAYYWRDEHRS